MIDMNTYMVIGMTELMTIKAAVDEITTIYESGHSGRLFFHLCSRRALLSLEEPS